MWDLPGPGLKPVSPALAGGFLTTAPPRKPAHRNFLITLFYIASQQLCCENQFISFTVLKSPLYFICFCRAITILFIHFVATRVTGGHFRPQTPEGQKALWPSACGWTEYLVLHVHWLRWLKRSSEQLSSKLSNGKIRSRCAVILLINNNKKFCSW